MTVINTSSGVVPRSRQGQDSALQKPNLDSIVPRLSEEGLRQRVDFLYTALRNNPHQPIGLLLNRQGTPHTRAKLLEAVTKVYADFRTSLISQVIDPSLPITVTMRDALCDFVLGCQCTEHESGGILATKRGRAPVLLLECLGGLADPRVTGDKVLSQNWQNVRSELDKLVLEKTRSPDGRSPYERKLPAIKSDQQIETEKYPLSPLERVIGFDLSHDREATSNVVRILRLARGIAEPQ